MGVTSSDVANLNHLKLFASIECIAKRVGWEKPVAGFRTDSLGEENLKELVLLDEGTGNYMFCVGDTELDAALYASFILGARYAKGTTICN